MPRLVILESHPDHGKNIGHGHAWPRPDGRTHRCGGRHHCSVCSVHFNANSIREATDSDMLALGWIRSTPYKLPSEGTGEKMSDIRVVVGVMRGFDGSYFVARRATKAYCGCWEFPGGKVEPGETDKMALTREWMEELATDIGSRIKDKLFEGKLALLNGDEFTIAAYDVELGAICRPWTAHDQIKWMKPEEILGLEEDQRTVSLIPILRNMPLTPDNR